MSEATAPLLDPLTDLSRQAAAYDWAANEALILDQRYRERQLPLLNSRARAPLGPDAGAAEYWPPIRSVVVPVDSRRLAADTGITAFLDDLRRSEVASSVWWPGVAMRADRMHATLVGGLQEGAELPARLDRRIEVLVRGPWIGRFNTGRIYLPVQAADRASATALAQLRTRTGAEHRPLLAGYLQLSGDVTGAAYHRLRAIVATHQNRIAVRLPLSELWLMDTMDDLVLRSHLAARIPLRNSSPHLAEEIQP
ncbi:hypothetical protein SAMN05428954_4873 [Streptomyces sp. 2112.3]|uniref:hypothetical protein n=1 Tax=Streptomyces sp. 2112.3 TaxID=1881023 RepID=UPI00089A3EE6|nr:hypothetical protein [Streptomyces sp. 2112.3]SEE96997.1 hypothetical protein SAMN05428954_4873 [Streptomyces sp. 2112.3]